CMSEIAYGAMNSPCLGAGVIDTAWYFSTRRGPPGGSRVGRGGRRPPGAALTDHFKWKKVSRAILNLFRDLICFLCALRSPPLATSCASGALALRERFPSLGERPWPDSDLLPLSRLRAHRTRAVQTAAPDTGAAPDTSLGGLRRQGCGAFR